MNYIVTAASIVEAAKKELDGSSIVFVLHEPDETVSVQAVADVYDKGAQMVFVRVENEKDKLMVIGGITARTDAVALEEGLACPQDFLGKIGQVFQKSGIVSNGRLGRAESFRDRVHVNTSANNA